VQGWLPWGARKRLRQDYRHVVRRQVINYYALTGCVDNVYTWR
jgi:hypothetical protein